MDSREDVHRVGEASWQSEVPAYLSTATLLPAQIRSSFRLSNSSFDRRAFSS